MSLTIRIRQIATTTALATLVACGAVVGADEQSDTELTLVEFIDAQFAQAWEDNEIQPSPVADDAEWVRRVYLDIVGHIPPADVVSDFLNDENPRKYGILIDKLLEDDGYVRNWTSIWTNLCIGRQTPRRVSRAGMTKFFREAFARNRPWRDIVVDIVTAEGHFEENGAVNFALAQMQADDDAVQMTAKTTRLFLGMQVQCTQCHNHPFNKWQQSQFWEFNSFFRQLAKRDVRKTDPNTGRQVDDYSEVIWRDFTGFVNFEKRNGQMMSALPTYFGKAIDMDSPNRREELARLMVEPTPLNDDGSELGPPMIATAFVNRTWSHFFGYGFTRPVDDLGPHNAASHPEVLERMAQEFADSNYDIKNLIRTICNTEAYRLTSQYGDNNAIDNPAAGELTLFSHMYMKAMEAEQLYDSLIVATNAHKSGGGDWDETERQRRRWMQQFVMTFDTDEGDEATTFNGTIPQALMLMNSELTRTAISGDRGSFLNELALGPGSDSAKIEKMYMATLSRKPTRAEAAAAGKLINSYPPDRRGMGYQDVFWALLNSNEFVMVH